MAQVYVYLPNDEAKLAARIGIKLSEKKVREFVFSGNKYNCYLGLLNPNDDEIHRNDKGFACVKLEVDERSCFVADSDIFPGEMYFSSIVPFSKYHLGSYRSPEALICCTLLPKNVSVQTGRFDSPLLYEDSITLYLENMQSFFSEKFDDFQNDQLLAFFEKLEAKGVCERIESKEVVTFVKESVHFTFRKADFGKYESVFEIFVV